MTTRTVVVDGIPHEVPSTAAAVIDKLVKDCGEALQLSVESDKKATDALTAHKAAIDKLNADHATAMDALRKDVITPEARDALVADWAKMLIDAKRLAPDVTTDGKTCLQVRREVIAAVTKDNATAKAVSDAVLAGSELEKAAADTVRAAFNAVAATVAETKSNPEAHKAIADALLGNTSVSTVDAHGLFTRNLTQGA